MPLPIQHSAASPSPAMLPTQPGAPPHAPAPPPAPCTPTVPRALHPHRHPRPAPPSTLFSPQEAPRGHPDCLTGKTFVISGVLDSLGREEATDYIKRHGGRVTGAVSGKTSFLVVGHHTGRSKYRKVGGCARDCVRGCAGLRSVFER